jgi:hypothetical protein
VRTSSLPPEIINRARQTLAPVEPIEILAQKANVAELDRIGAEDWLTLYLFETSDSGSKYYFCALAPESHIEAAMAHDSSDLMTDHGFPGFSQTYDGRGGTVTTYERSTSAPIEPLLYIRHFHGLKPTQIDLSEEFRLFHNLYHDRQNDRYVHVDERGEDEIAIEVTPNQVRAKTRYVRQYLAARQLYLLIFFDHRADAEIELASAKATLSDQNIQQADLRYFFHVGDLSIGKRKTFSRLLGKKMIVPPPVDQSGLWPYERRVKQFAEFIISTDKNGRSISHIADEDELANYFGKNPGAPHYLTPVWFRREVLRKYYDHPEKYSVEDGYLRCGGLWGLRMDNDLPSHVVVFLGDLGHLAYEEQLYWKSFNIPPQSDRTSDAHYRRSFLAEFADPSSPDLVLKQKLVALQEGWEQRFAWQLFRPLQKEDAHVVKQLRIPLTEGMGEFEQQILLLAKLIIDSLNDAKLTEELAAALPVEKSISKFERFLKARGYPYTDRDAKLLRLLQSVRSAAAAHRKGKQFNRISKELQLSDRSASDVFRELIGQVNAMLTDLEAHFISN